MNSIQKSVISLAISAGKVSVIGDAKDIKVYNLSGMLISQNMTEMSLNPSVYVIVVDGQKFKVAVK